MNSDIIELIKQNLVNKKNLFFYNFNKFLKNSISDDYIDILTEFLIKSDVSLDTTEKMINLLKKYKNDNLDSLKNNLSLVMNDILSPCEQNLNLNFCKPFLILVIGVNGVGKTTTVGKIANLYKQSGKKVAVVAGDTFRVAGIQQLFCISQKNEIPIIKQHYRADSASVIFDAANIAKNQNFDVLVIDTSGRLHTDKKLMSELSKINSVLKKVDLNFPNEIMMIIDANFGQNSLSQIKIFNDHIKISGLSISKLDGTAKAGIIFSIADHFKIPIRYVCDGEDISDIKTFNSKSYIYNLFKSF